MRDGDQDRVPRVWFKGPREPHWTCPADGCKASKNFACRVRCQLCDGRAPPEVFKAAKAADARAKATADGKAKPVVGLAPGRDKELADLRAQLRVLIEDKERRAREKEEEMEEGGFAVTKSRGQKRKEKKQAAAATRKAPPAAAGAGKAIQSRSTVAAVRKEDLPFADDDGMEDVDGSAASEETTRDKAERLAKVVKGLEALLEANDDDQVRTTLEAKQKELDDANAAIKLEVAAAKPTWKSMREIEAKRSKKRQVLDKAKANKEQLESNLADWLEAKMAEEAEKRKSIEAAQARCDELAVEVAALDQEYNDADERFKLGKGNTVLQDITQCLLECPSDPSHEVVLALNSAHALIQGAKSTADARIAAAKAAGVAIAPADEAGTPEEARVHATVLEFTRQLHQNAQAFIDGQKAMEEHRATSLRHLASLQATRAAAPLVSVPPSGDAAVSAASGGDGSAPSYVLAPARAVAQPPDAAAAAVALAVDAGRQAEQLGAAAVPVPADM